MAGKKILLILWMYRALSTEAPPSRFLNLFDNLRPSFPDTWVIMQGNGEHGHGDGHIREVTPWIPIRGRFRLGKGLIFRIKAAVATVTLILAKKIDCVIMRGEDTILILPLLKVLGIFVIYDFHGLKSLELLHEGRRFRAALVRALEGILLRSSDRILVVSRGMVPQIRIHEKKCIYLPNGVNIPEIERSTRDCGITLPPHRHVIGFLGNWEQCMRIEDICDAARYLEGTIAVIIGKGYQADAYRAKYRDRMEVVFTGRIERECAYTLLKQFDVGIVPYDRDSYMSGIEDFFSNRKVFEYLAAGRPIILSDIAGRPGFLRENTNFIGYESGNPRDLADKIRHLFENPDLARQMGENNARLAGEYSWGGLVEASGLADAIRNG